MGTGCPPNTAEYLKIYSDLAAVEDFARFKCCDGSFSRNKACVNATLNKKKKIKEAGMPGVFLCDE